MHMRMTYGYGRVSAQRQTLDRQEDMLRERGCERVFMEKATGIKADRPELLRLKDCVRPGDTLIIESWSRLGRSTKDLIELTEWFLERGVQVVSLKENFDTSTPQGRMMLTIFQAFAQFERDLIAQRTREGLASARARGRKGGRPPKRKRDVELALKLYDSKLHTVAEIVRLSGVSQSTLYRYLAKRREN
jgi:DNA invertase Pin-like site-specific DNA recombinase